MVERGVTRWITTDKNHQPQGSRIPDVEGHGQRGKKGKDTT